MMGAVQSGGSSNMSELLRFTSEDGAVVLVEAAEAPWGARQRLDRCGTTAPCTWSGLSARRSASWTTRSAGPASYTSCNTWATARRTTAPKPGSSCSKTSAAARRR